VVPVYPGPHLDFRVYKNDSPIDPLKWNHHPWIIRPENKTAFNAARANTMEILTGITKQTSLANWKNT
jgi:hypothetical protein